MKAQFGKDFTQGSIPKHLIKFLLPVLTGSIVTTGYSIINAIWVGNLLGGDAVGAIASAFPVIMLINALITGFTTAASILIARFYGSRQLDRMQKTVNCSWTVAFIAVAIITTAGILAAEPILKALNTQPVFVGLAVDYLKITFASVAFMYFSTLIVSILRGIGDTATPMIFMVLSTVINAILDPLLIKGAGPLPTLGLNGAALASLISMAVATVAGFLYTKKKYRGQPVLFTVLDANQHTLAEIVQLGLPSFVQQALISVSAAFIVFLVNGFGTAAMDAYGVASRVDTIAIMPAMAMFMVVSTLTAQNIGAKMFLRIRSIFKWGLIINSAIIATISALVVVFSGGVMGLFVQDQAIIRTGMQYFTIVGASYILFAVSFVTNGIINGSGKTSVTLVFSIVSLLIIRIPLAWVLSHTELGLQGIWLAVAISYAATAAMSMSYYLAGRWRKKVGIIGKVTVGNVEIAGEQA